MSTAGQILLHRKIVEWEWYTDINTCRLFIHMLTGEKSPAQISVSASPLL